MSGPVAGIVFDMDGTLIESHEVVPAAYRAAVLAGGGPERTDAEVIAGYSLGAPVDLLTHLLGRPATEADLAAYHGHLAALAERVTVYPGVAEVLAEVAARVPVGLFTGASHRAAEILLDRVGLLGRFGVVLGGDQAPPQAGAGRRRAGLPPAGRLAGPRRVRG